MHIYTVLWDCKYTGHQSQEICRCPWLAIAKTWGSRGVHKLSSDRNQQSEARQREGSQVASTACLPEIHSVSHQMCTKPEACPSGRSARMPKRPPSQKDWWGAGARSAVCAVPCQGDLSRNISDGHSSVGPRDASTPATKAGRPKGIPWVQPQKLGHHM